jgi:hypothetical protein
MFFDPDGAELDWIVGYGPPAEDFQKKIDLVLQGVGTYKDLAAKAAADPRSVEANFRLAEKWEDRYDQAKAAEFYKKVVTLDPDGTKGTTEYGRDKAKVSTPSSPNSTSPPARVPAPTSPCSRLCAKYPDSQIVRTPTAA